MIDLYLDYLSLAGILDTSVKATVVSETEKRVLRNIDIDRVEIRIMYINTDRNKPVT